MGVEGGTVARSILTWPDSRLKAFCQSVRDEELALRIERDLFAALPEGALGLAAPQIGWTYRVFVMRGWQHAFVNPSIEATDEDEVRPEACLSLPGVVIPVPRAKKIKLRAFDADRLDGPARTFKMRHMDARCAQHEFDHLEGKLITAYK